MAEVTVNALVEGGAASAGPPLGPALGPLGVNIGAIIKEINDKTKEFKGIKVPVKVIVNKETKEFRIEVGTPPVAELLKKRAGITKGRKEKGEIAGNVSLDDVIAIAKSIRDKSRGKTLKATVKEVLGTALSVGITCDGKNPREVIKEINEGQYDAILKE